MGKLVAVSLFLFLIMSITGCGITIIPRPNNLSDKVNKSDRSITIKRDVLTLTARVQDTEVGGYSHETPLTSFYVAAVNHTTSPITLPLSSFTLVDDQNVIYQAISPESVNALLLPEFDYLLPFPYVAILDVVAQESQRGASAMQSEQPYVGRGLDIDPVGLPFETTVESGTRSAGAIFFEIDLYLLNYVRLKVDDPSGHNSYIFPFSIEK